MTTAEILAPQLSSKQVSSIERDARKLWNSLEKTSIIFAMELRRLQDGGAHLTRGYPNFGEYVEVTFPGIRAVNAQMISRQGHVLLILEERGKINPSMSVDELPGTTGVRALAKVIKTFDENAMVQVYDKAASYGRKMTDETVAAALRELFPPAPSELGAGEDEAESVDPDDDKEGEEQFSPKVSELIDHIRDLSYDLPETLADIEAATKRLREEIEQSPNEADKQWLVSHR